MAHSTSDTNPQILLNTYRIFFVGIGGISMSGLAELALRSGWQVAGSDRHLTSRTRDLEGLGIPVFNGHQASWIDQFNPDLVVHTAAVHDDNPELIRARTLNIRTIDRAQFLGWLNRLYSRVVNIAGTHGKTTTTAMTALILMESGVDPTVHLGAELIQFHSTVRVGAPGKVMVSEACEYMNSYHKFYSTSAAVLNIDYDHVDCFSSISAVIDSFTEFSDRLPDDGSLIIPDFDPHVKVMLTQLAKQRQQSGQSMPRLIYFGSAESDITGPQPDFGYRNLTYEQGLPRFDVWHHGSFYCRVSLQVPGQHNVVNALAAIACSSLEGGTPEAASRALNSFQGAEGRFTQAGQYRGAAVIADYAHHPAAVRATLAAASYMPNPHTWVVFQPLTFSRTKVLLDDFAQALKNCELVLLAEVFSDRESSNGGVSSSQLAERINSLGGHAEFIPSFAAITARLDEVVQPGDLILVLGPEDIRSLADQMTDRLKGKR